MRFKKKKKDNNNNNNNKKPIDHKSPNLDQQAHNECPHHGTVLALAVGAGDNTQKLQQYRGKWHHGRQIKRCIRSGAVVDELRQCFDDRLQFCRCCPLSVKIVFLIKHIEIVRIKLLNTKSVIKNTDHSSPQRNRRALKTVIHALAGKCMHDQSSKLSWVQ